MTGPANDQDETATSGKLKLGIHPDASVKKRYSHSGGYCWISEKNPSSANVSVYRGSIFEASTHTPTQILKLMYHWCCQTTVTNVKQWVKVDDHSVNFYWKLMRSLCVGTVQNELVNLGGANKIVEIGVISLGTTQGNAREVKVEVLGVMERATGKLRLKATEPVKGASSDERFTRIFEPIPLWIDHDSKIITDFSIDKEHLSRLGYNNVQQGSYTTNDMVMEYLKKVVPKMFQVLPLILPYLLFAFTEFYCHSVKIN